MTAETPEQRRGREQQRVLFDGVAGRYDATRPGYPAEIADAVVASAAIGPGSAVPETGWFLGYTGQDQSDFAAGLRSLLLPGSHVGLVQETFCAMASTPA